MSNIYMFDDGMIYTQVGFLMSESVKPRHVEFGTDLKNGNWLEFNNGNSKLVATYFQHFDKSTNKFKFYRMFLDDSGEVGFGAAENFDIAQANNLEYVITGFSDKPQKTGNALVVFNYVYYLILLALDVYNFNHVIYSPANPSLGKVYEVMVKNKGFIEEFRKHGFDYKGLVNDQFTFEREIKTNEY